MISSTIVKNLIFLTCCKIFSQYSFKSFFKPNFEDNYKENGFSYQLDH